jgi:hypothetical protein
MNISEEKRNHNYTLLYSDFILFGGNHAIPSLIE